MPRLLKLFILSLLGITAGVRGEEIKRAELGVPSVASTRIVLQAIVAAAEDPASSHDKDARNKATTEEQHGDQLTELYVQAAAEAANRLPREHRSEAFLVGLAIGLDDSDLMREHRLTAGLWRQIESDAEREHRLRHLGRPTMHGRHDWAQHFAVSAGLTAIMGANMAESAGLLKESSDMNGGSGFSFTDYCADLAGIALAESLRRDPDRLKRISESFAIADYVPDLSGLREELPPTEFRLHYGSYLDSRFLSIRKDILSRIAKLPAYAQSEERESAPVQ